MPYDPNRLEGRFLAGDPEAIAVVGNWTARVLSSMTFWSLRKEWKDLHQETMGRLLESLRHGRFDARQDFKTYTQGIARIAGLRALGRSGRAPEKDAPALDDAGDVAPLRRPDSEAFSQQLARQVLERSSDECRAILSELYLEGSSCSEIAEARGLPLGTVKSRLSRCLEAAHRLISGKGPRKDF